MICDVFGLDNADAFVADYRSANYEEFTGMIKAIDDYINGKGGEKVTLSGTLSQRGLSQRGSGTLYKC